MKKLKFITSVILSMALLNAHAQTKHKKIVSEKYIFPLQDKHSHSSSIVELPNGDFLTVWFYGTGERKANDVKLMGARLKKGQKKWSEPFEMADTENVPDCNPIMFLNKDQKLFLVWIAVYSNQWEGAILKVKTTKDYLGKGAPKWEWQDNILLNPGDDFVEDVAQKVEQLPKLNGIAWAEYIPRYDDLLKEAVKDKIKRSIGWMPRIAPIILENGRILLPLYSDGFNLSLIAISDNDGRTWEPSLPIVGRGNIQPSLMQKKNGEVVAYMRDNGFTPGRVQMSTSSDNGQSWTACAPLDIPNPGSSVASIVLSDGRWIMVCNDVEDGRRKLSLYLSDNEGDVWEHNHTIEQNDKGRYGYPSLLQAKDGKVHLTYTYTEEDKKVKTIKHVVFDSSKL